MGGFIYVSIIIVKTQVEKPNLDEATTCGIIVLSRLDILQINCVVPVTEEHFPKWVHSPKEHSRAPCFQPYYHSMERELPTHKGDVMDIFCLHP
jgi:hypothetical protein